MAYARGAVLAVDDAGALRREIIEYYKQCLAQAVPPWGDRWVPVRIGPSWGWENGAWSLPECSLGWEVLAWCGKWLLGKDRRTPWVFTPEQARFILWFYATNETGTGFVYSQAVLQRLKGWGKDPLAATLAVFSMLGPCIPDGIGVDGLVKGRPHPAPWVQVAAVAQEQTKNTFKLFPGLLSPECVSEFGVQVNKTALWGLGDRAQVQAVTNNPYTIEGGRPSFIICNETQNWNVSNAGHEMWGALAGNAAKAEVGLPARRLSICNAYRPGEDSVAQRAREGWESTQGDNATHAEYGLLYDSLEAPLDAPLTAEAAVEVVEAVRGDAVWLSAKGEILDSILDPMSPPSESRRKWYNQVDAEEDSWLAPREWDACAGEGLVLDAGDEVCLFFDGGKNDDATGLVACRVSDGAVFTVGMWQRPPGRRGDGWEAPRGEIDGVVRGFVEAHNVVALFADPSHVRDDETMELFWHPIIDRWHREFSRRLRLWAARGRGGHACLWDMSDPKNHARFVGHLGIVTGEILGESLLHDGDVRLRNHVLNARRMPTRYGVSIAKNHRESRRKIDLAVCMVGARMVRRMYLNSGRRGGSVW